MGEKQSDVNGYKPNTNIKNLKNNELLKINKKGQINIPAEYLFSKN